MPGGSAPAPRLVKRLNPVLRQRKGQSLSVIFLMEVDHPSQPELPTFARSLGRARDGRAIDRGSKQMMDFGFVAARGIFIQ